jgi:Tol biopolymer transport system component
VTRGIIAAAVVASAVVLVPAQASLAAAPATTVNVSVTSDGTLATGAVVGGDISADGTRTVFEARNSGLIPGGADRIDVFLHDETTGETRQVSVGYNGEPAGNSGWPVISGDGKWIAYSSWAGNIVEGDTNDTDDVFLYEVATGATTRVSLTKQGEQTPMGGSSPSISDDGSRIAFVSLGHLDGLDLNGGADVFVHDRTTGKTLRASVDSDELGVNRPAGTARISGNGRFVLFTTDATNLVPGTVKHHDNVYVRDLATRTTSMLTTSAAGAPGDGYSQGQTISKSGRYVVVYSTAANLIDGDDAESDLFVFDRVTGGRSKISRGNGNAYGASISDTGRFVAFTSTASDLVPGDTNHASDAFVLDRQSGAVELVSVGNGGQQTSMLEAVSSISGDGRSLVFGAVAQDLVPGGSRYFNQFVRHFRP